MIFPAPANYITIDGNIFNASQWIKVELEEIPPVNAGAPATYNIVAYISVSDKILLKSFSDKTSADNFLQKISQIFYAITV